MRNDLAEQHEVKKAGGTYRRLRGEARTATGQLLSDRYEAGASIRQLMEEFHLSYGLTRNLLREAGVELRARGRSTT